MSNQRLVGIQLLQQSATQVKLLKLVFQNYGVYDYLVCYVMCICTHFN